MPIGGETEVSESPMNNLTEATTFSTWRRHWKSLVSDICLIVVVAMMICVINGGGGLWWIRVVGNGKHKKKERSTDQITGAHGGPAGVARRRRTAFSDRWPEYSS
ncbi:hypothetical protein M6B38_368210 [Iris pallida]|uniref:Uncharacterized protein n=1 Tax=Iris pallida TaxID=29817 RepID=A0AAX6GFY6_IRIPA|nr:hypothetical protein M6B38_368210 [Iris pallida]